MIQNEVSYQGKTFPADFGKLRRQRWHLHIAKDLYQLKLMHIRINPLSFSKTSSQTLAMSHLLKLCQNVSKMAKQTFKSNVVNQWRCCFHGPTFDASGSLGTSDSDIMLALRCQCDILIILYYGIIYYKSHVFNCLHIVKYSSLKKEHQNCSASKVEENLNPWGTHQLGWQACLIYLEVKTC